MKKFTIWTLIALIALAMPVLAGEGKEKCDGTTQECLNMMAKQMMHKGLIGVEGEMSDDGYVVTSFMEQSTAKAAGLAKGDILVAVNGIALMDKEAAQADMKNRKPGNVAKVSVLRGGEKHAFEIELVGMSDEQIAQYVGKHMLDHAEVEVASNEE